MKYRVAVAIVIVGLCIGGFLFLNNTPEQVDDRTIEYIDAMFNNDRSVIVSVDAGRGEIVTDSFIELARPLYEDKDYQGIVDLLTEKGYSFSRIYSKDGEPVSNLKKSNENMR